MKKSALHVVPDPIRKFLTITEVDDADFLVGELFRRKFGDPPPDFPRHLVALYRDRSGAEHLAGFSHMRPFGDVYLSGGSCTNGKTLRLMQADELQAVHNAGGVWHLILKYAFAKFADDCDAFFGHCGDPRALEVALGAGFIKTDTPPIIVNWHKPLPDVFKRALMAKVVALGPF